MRRAGIFPEKQLPGCSRPSLRRELSTGLGARGGGCPLKREVTRGKGDCCALGRISKSSDHGEQLEVWLFSEVLSKDETSSRRLRH